MENLVVFLKLKILKLVIKKDNPKNHSFSHFGKECANQKQNYQDKKKLF
jgi:hypothetical protein